MNVEAACKPGRAPTAVDVDFASPDLNLSNLLAALLDELLNSGLLAITTASIATWMMKRPSEMVRSDLSTFLPPAPILFPQCVLKLCLQPSTQCVLAALREYYDRLAFVRSLTKTFVTQPSKQAQTSMEVITNAWQDLSSTCKIALTALGERLGGHTAIANNARYNKLSSLIADIEMGHHPCVTREGVVAVPFWADRRTLKRRPTSLEAFVIVDDLIQKVAVVNASDFGVGVLGLTCGTVGAEVELLLRPGFSIRGEIVWTRDGQAGITLQSSLPAGSSFLTLDS